MDPLLIDIPDQFETDRLLIRVPRAGDGERINRLVVESAAELQVYMPWAKPLPTVEQSEAFARRSYADFLGRKDMNLSVYLRDTGELVGGTGLHDFDWRIPKTEIGYWLGTRFWGRGYMTEAVKGLADLALGQLGMRRIQIKCDEENLRSRRVAERCGFAPEGLMRNDSLDPAGRVRSTLLFARTAGS